MPADGARLPGQRRHVDSQLDLQPAARRRPGRGRRRPAARRRARRSSRVDPARGPSRRTDPLRQDPQRLDRPLRAVLLREAEDRVDDDHDDDRDRQLRHAAERQRGRAGPQQQREGLREVVSQSRSSRWGPSPGLRARSARPSPETPTSAEVDSMPRSSRLAAGDERCCETSSHRGRRRGRGPDSRRAGRRSGRRQRVAVASAGLAGRTVGQAGGKHVDPTGVQVVGEGPRARGTAVDVDRGADGAGERLRHGDDPARSRRRRPGARRSSR